MLSTVSGLHCSWDTVDAAPPVNPSLPSQSQSPLALVPSPFWLIDVFKDSFYLLQCKPYVWTDSICCFIPNKHFYLAYSDSELFKQLTPKRAEMLPQTWAIQRQHKTGLNEALRCCTLKSLHPSQFSLSPPRRRLSPGQLYSTDSWVPKGDFHSTYQKLGLARLTSHVPAYKLFPALWKTWHFVISTNVPMGNYSS